MTDRLRLEAEVISLRTKHPFKIARHEHHDIRSVVVRLHDQDGHVGLGEASPQAYYGETPETVLAALGVYATVLPEDPFDLEGTEARFRKALDGNASARVALSTALHDLVGKRLGVSRFKVGRLLDLEELGVFRTWSPDALAARVREAGFENVAVERVFGEPPQAILVSADRPRA